MKGITRSNLKEFTKDELIEVCILLADTENIRIRGIQGYAKQLKDMADFLNDENLVAGIEDSKDKTWDRGHKVMENFGEYLENLSAMEEKLLPEKQETVTKLSASKKSILELGRDNG